MQPSPGIPTPVLSELSCQMHNLSDQDHAVASALGVWLRLALTSDGVPSTDVRELEELLGGPLPQAMAYAEALLSTPHPAVAAAAALWTRPEFETDAFKNWASALTPAVEQGAVPTQEAADTWARERTDGLIDHFPMTVNEDTLMILASALAARVSWTTPFELASSRAAPGKWPADVTKVLRSPDGVRRFIVGDALSGIGDVAVHEARSDALSVVSVAALPIHPRSAVLSAAHRIAAAFVPAWASDEQLGVRSLFDLELGKNECWDLKETSGTVFNDSGVEEVIDAYLPAWHADTKVDLAGIRSMPLIARRLKGLLRPHPAGKIFDARQAATADFYRTGFAAAAVTALGVAAGSGPPKPRPGLIRRARLHFDQPHAVVATALDYSSYGERDPSPWTGLPVFSAWITEILEGK